MPETIKVPGATQLLLVAADVNDQVGVSVVLAAYSAFVLSGRSQNSETAYAAQIPQHFHDTATTVFVPVQEQLSVWETIIARLRGLTVGQCSAVMAAAPNVHCILVTTFERLIFQFGGQVS